MDADIYEPYDRLVRIRVLGREAMVPEHNLLLRCFQFVEPENVPYGDFCWNGTCHNCSLTLRRDGAEQEVLACQTVVREGDEVVDAGREVQKALREWLDS